MKKDLIWIAAGAALVIMLLGLTNTYNSTHTQIVFEGAFRILKGQMPFRDFAAPVGPLSFYLLAGLFKAAGVSWLSFILFGALINAAAACAAYLAARRAFDDRRLALAVAATTALWHQAFIIWPWYGQASIAFTFAALAALQGRRSFKAGAAAGVLLALGVFTKQTTGGISLVALALYLAALGEWACLRGLVAGAAAAGAALTALFGGLAGRAFVEDFILRPLTARRVAPLPGSAYPLWAVLSAAAFAAGVKLSRARREWPLWAACAGAAGLCFVWRSNTLMDATIPYTAYFCVPFAAAALLEPRARALLLALTLIQIGDRLTSQTETYFFWYFVPFQAALLVEGLRGKLFQDFAGKAIGSRLTALSAPALFGFLVFAAARFHLAFHWPLLRALPMIGPVLALASGAAAAALLYRRHWAPAAALALVFAFAALQTADAVSRWTRGFAAAPASACGRTVWVDLPGLTGMRLCEDQARTYRELASILAASERPVLIVPEHHFLYAALDQAPPFPFLWLDRGLTYRPGPETDERLIAATREVRTIVLTASDPGAFAMEFPGFDAWMRREFVLRANPAGATVFARKP